MDIEARLADLDARITAQEYAHIEAMAELARIDEKLAAAATDHRPLFDPAAICPLCGDAGGEGEHGIQMVMDPQKDLTIDLYVSRRCESCGYTWCEQAPTAEQARERGGRADIGFGAKNE